MKRSREACRSTTLRKEINMPSTFITEGICVVCGEKALVSPQASKCKKCVIKRSTNQRVKRYREDPEYREFRQKESLTFSKKRKQDPENVAQDNKRRNAWHKKKCEEDPEYKAKHNKRKNAARKKLRAKKKP